MITEYEEQCKVVEYYNSKNILGFAVINDGVKSIGQAKKQQKMGLRSGISDLILVFKKGVLFLEMKRSRRVLKNGNLSKQNLASENQLKMKKYFDENIESSAYEIAYGFDEAKELIDKYEKKWNGV